MSWWDPTRLAGFRGPLTQRLRRWTLPFWAVFQTDLAAMVRSWVLRAWLGLTIVAALIAVLDHRGPTPGAARPGENAIVTAILHPIETSAGPAQTLRDLLKAYLIVWTSFIVMLTGGAITSELGVIADSVLSRGTSRWQYFFGKLCSRLAVVLGAYAIVVLPASAAIWLGGGSTHRAAAVAPAGAPQEMRSFDSIEPDANHEAPAPLSFVGTMLGLARVAAVLGLVVTCAVAFSATFANTAIAIGVAWVTVYGSGALALLLDMPHLSPGRLLGDLPAVLEGRIVVAEQAWIIAMWIVASGVISLASGVIFSRRDL